jgi:hypothetical protein
MKEITVEMYDLGIEAWGNVFPADRFVCTLCNHTIIKLWEDEEIPGRVIRDVNHDKFSEYIKLKE